MPITGDPALVPEGKGSNSRCHYGTVFSLAFVVALLASGLLPQEVCWNSSPRLHMELREMT